MMLEVQDLHAYYGKSHIAPDRVAGTLCRSVMVIASMHDEARLGNDH